MLRPVIVVMAVVLVLLAVGHVLNLALPSVGFMDIGDLATESSFGT